MSSIPDLNVLRTAGWKVEPFGDGEIARTSNGTIGFTTYSWTYSSTIARIARTSNGTIGFTVSSLEDEVLMNLDDSVTGDVKSFMIKADQKLAEALSIVVDEQPGVTADNFRALARKIVEAGAGLQVEIDGEFVDVEP